MLIHTAYRLCRSDLVSFLTWNLRGRGSEEGTPTLGHRGRENEEMVLDVTQDKDACCMFVLVKKICFGDVSV